MANTPSLGDLLRQKIASDEAAAARAEQERLAAEQAEKDKNHRTLTTFFGDARAHFETAIIAGRAIKGIQVGGGKRPEVAELIENYSTPKVNQSTHPYHSYWRDFADWARQNGLEALWEYEHDGVGIQSWHILTVRPLSV